MYENTVATTETEVKKHPKAIKIIGIILAILMVIFAGIYTWYYFTERSYQKNINNISISNISSNSATISWTTYTQDTGQIEINIDDKFFFISALKKNQKFYDSRDIVEISQGKYELEQKGKYYVHHVTINGLEPETEYNYRFSTGIFTTSIGGKIKTFPIQESIKTPNPIYGYVFDQYGEPYDDVIVRAYVNNPNNGVSQNITSVTDKGIGWSMDIGTIYSVSGQDLSFEEDWTLVVEAIGPYTQKKIEVPNTKVKPVDNIVLERQSFTDEAEKAEITSKSRLNNILVGHVFADACSQIPVEDCPDFESIGCEVRYNKCVMTVPIVQPVEVDKCGDGICSDGEDCSQDCTCGNSKCDDTDKDQGCNEECADEQNLNNNCQWAYFCGPYQNVNGTMCSLDQNALKTLQTRGCDSCEEFLNSSACEQTAKIGLNCNWSTEEKKCLNGDIKPAIQINKKYFCDEIGTSLIECKNGDQTNCSAPKECKNGGCIVSATGDDYCAAVINNIEDGNANVISQEDQDCEQYNGKMEECNESGCEYLVSTKKCSPETNNYGVNSVTTDTIQICSRINAEKNQEKREKLCNISSDICTLSKKSECVAKEIVVGASCAKLVENACLQRTDCIYSGEPAKCREKSEIATQFLDCSERNYSTCAVDSKCLWESSVQQCIYKTNSIANNQFVDCNTFNDINGQATPECKFEKTRQKCTTQYNPTLGAYECISLNEIANYGYQAGAGICVAIGNSVVEINQGPGTGEGYSHNDAYGCAFDVLVYAADITNQVDEDMVDCYTTVASTGCTAITTNANGTQFEFGHLAQESCADVGESNKGSCRTLITGGTGAYFTGEHLHYGIVGETGQDCNVDELIASFPGSDFFSCDKKLEYVGIDTTGEQGSNSLFNGNYEYISKLNNFLITPIGAQEIETVSKIESGVYTISQGNEIKKAVYVSPDTQALLFDDANGNSIKDSGEVFLSVDGIEALGYEIEKISTSEIYSINKGWNLVHFPYVFEGENSLDIKKASDLMYIMNAQGADVTNISTYRDGNFIIFTTRILADGSIVEFGDNFNIIPGEAYFLLSYKQADVEITGMQIDGPLEIPLNTGWNLVGIFNSNQEEYSAFEVLDQINNDGISADTISKWDSSKYTNVVKVDENEYGFDYTIFPQQGYFVRVLSEGTNSFSPK